ncbi:MAG: hypothetical protein JSS02_04995 [Planctomycetes bacterium]|nr:hypothetical protein [Planctomycetota bacterium]
MSDELRIRDQAYLNLLHWGLLMVRDSACSGHLDLCRIESDHIHNIPSLFGESNELRHVYYIEQERGLYLERLVAAGAGEYADDAKSRYAESWRILAEAAGVRLSE